MYFTNLSSSLLTVFISKYPKKHPLIFSFLSLLILTILITSTSEASSPPKVESPQAEKTTLTLYSNLALIHEIRNIALEKGVNQLILKGVSGQIRPTTVQIEMESKTPFTLLEQNFDYDLLSPEALIKKMVGETITIRKYSDKERTFFEDIQATLLTTNGGYLIQYEDRIEHGLPQNSEFIFKEIPEHLNISPTLSLLLNVKKSEETRLNLLYLSRGFSWSTDYVATISEDERTFDLTGWVTLKNESGTAFIDTDVRLIAGTIHEILPHSYPAPMARAATMYDLAESAPLPKGESFSDYHLYTLPMSTSVKNNQEKQLVLLRASAVPLTKEYRFTHQNNNRSDTKNIKAKVNLLIKNSEENNLGLPLPQGIFRVYQKHTKGDSLFLGEDRIPHVAKNEYFTIHTGEAFDISASEKTITYNQLSKTRYQSTHEVIFNNASEKEVIVTYEEFFNPRYHWSILESSHKVTTKTASYAQWQITLPPESETTLNYQADVETKIAP